MSNAAMKYSLTSTYVDNFFSFFFFEKSSRSQMAESCDQSMFTY